MHRVCITKRPREIWQNLTNFWIKQNNILILFECLQLSEHFLLPERQKRSHCSFMRFFEEKSFLHLQIRRHGPIISAKANWISFDICSRFYLSTSPSQTRVMEFIIINLFFIWILCLTNQCTFAKPLPPRKRN